MKPFFTVVFLALSACGSADHLADSLDKLAATPAPMAPVEPPGVVWTATPLPAYPTASRNMAADYQKISEGMKREEIVKILGEPHEKKTKNFCTGGECEDYEYFSWFYKGGKIGVTIQLGIAVFTFAN